MTTMMVVEMVTVVMLTLLMWREAGMLAAMLVYGINDC